MIAMPVHRPALLVPYLPTRTRTGTPGRGTVLPVHTTGTGVPVHILGTVLVLVLWYTRHSPMESNGDPCHEGLMETHAKQPREPIGTPMGPHWDPWGRMRAHEGRMGIHGEA